MYTTAARLQKGADRRAAVPTMSLAASYAMLKRGTGITAVAMAPAPLPDETIAVQLLPHGLPVNTQSGAELLFLFGLLTVYLLSTEFASLTSPFRRERDLPREAEAKASAAAALLPDDSHYNSGLDEENAYDQLNAWLLRSAPGTAAGSATSARSGAMRWGAGAPLPTIPDLEDSCYVVSEAFDEDGKPSGLNWCICTTPSDGSTCVEEEDFSAYYDMPIYLCQV